VKVKKDILTLRELAKRVRDIAAKPVQEERRALWRKHNSLVRTRPLVLVLGAPWWSSEAPPEYKCVCEDPFYRGHERVLRQRIFQDTIGDDTIQEPWITQGATRITPPDGPWGLKYGRIPSPEQRGSWLFDPPLKRWEDFQRLVRPRHLIDEEATARNVQRLQDAVGDILEVCVDRAPFYREWHADISYSLAHLRGLEQVMWDMTQNPEWLHRLARFMCEAVLEIQEEAERRGDWRLCNHSNQAMPYSLELPDPQANSPPVKRKQLWYFVAAQEMAQVSPAMHEEFVFQYQRRIAENFGLVAYGCCEDLTHKIDMLRRLPNLRRIAVTPVADVRRCAEQIQDKYVFSWRPNPAEMICCGFDPAHVRKVIRQGLEAAKGCHVDITLKDHETLQGHPENLRKWVQVVRSVADKYA